MEEVQLARTVYLMETNNSLVEHMLHLLAALLRDVACTYSYKHINRDLDYVKTRTVKEGLQFLTVSLPSLGKSLDFSLSQRQPFRAVGFKKASGRTTPEFLGWLFEGVFDADGIELPDACPIRVLHIRQLSYIFYKAELPYAEHLNDKVINQFVETDKALLDIDYTSIPSKILNFAANLIAKVCCEVDPARFIPRHGPGSVSTREQQWNKMRFTRFYPALDEVFTYCDYFMSGSMDICDNYHNLHKVSPSDPGTAKVVLVPKDSRGPRLISCEPLEYQYCQQGVSQELVRAIESHRYTKTRVNFRDQSINQRYARWGSMGAKWVTLDMKDASDRVSVVLVQRLFEKTHLLEYLMACRSSATRLPNGDIVFLNKFAPMGSALCFPVEALVFWALSVSCIVYANTDPVHESVKLSRALSATRVYGDDLILHTDDYGAVMQYLPLVGLKFNERKCCTLGFFRESCGFDAYKGTKVTPVRCRHVWDARISHTQQLLSSVELSNSLYSHGYWESAELLRDLIVRKYGKNIPVIDHDKPVSFICFRRLTESLHSNDVSCRTKWCRKTHQLLIRALSVVSVPISRDLTGYEKLRWSLIRSSSTLSTRVVKTDLRTFAKTFVTPAAHSVCMFPVRGRVTHKPLWRPLGR